SGAFAKLSRTTADVLPSFATDTQGTKFPCASVSGPAHTGVTVPFNSSLETNVSPVAIPVTRIPSPLGSHASDVAVDVHSGVKFFTSPPFTGVEYTSPPGIGSSLI